MLLCILVSMVSATPTGHTVKIICNAGHAVTAGDTEQAACSQSAQPHPLAIATQAAVSAARCAQPVHLRHHGAAGPCCGSPTQHTERMEAGLGMHVMRLPQALPAWVSGPYALGQCLQA